MASKKASATKAKVSSKSAKPAGEPASVDIPATIDTPAAVDVSTAATASVCEEPAPAAEAVASSEAVQLSEAVRSSEPLVKIEGSLDIKHVEEIRIRFAALLDGGGPAVVELDRVATVDTAGIQLLLALRADAGSRGVAVEFRGHSQIVLSGLELLGLQDLLPAASSHGV